MWLTDERYLLNLFLDGKLRRLLKFCSSHEYTYKGGKCYFHRLLFPSYVQKQKRLHVEPMYFFIFPKFSEQNELSNPLHTFLDMYVKNKY